MIQLTGKLEMIKIKNNVVKTSIIVLITLLLGLNVLAICHASKEDKQLQNEPPTKHWFRCEICGHLVDERYMDIHKKIVHEMFGLDETD